MCLILVAWRSHPHYPLVVAANRDEFFTRRTASADFWDDHPQVLGGRDIEGGGTWMGVTRAGRFAALTNYRDPTSQRPDAPSRGTLVADFLAGDDDIDAYLARIVPRAADYNGFNLLLGDAIGKNRRLVWYSNVAGQPTDLAPGVYGVSNHLLDSPWPKVGAGKTALAAALGALPDAEPLFGLLRDDGMHPDETLPRTGVGLEWERLLSSAFVRAPGYGTRSSTVLTVAADGTVDFEERTWLEGARPGGQATFRWPVLDSRQTGEFE